MDKREREAREIPGVLVMVGLGVLVGMRVPVGVIVGVKVRVKVAVGEPGVKVSVA